MLHGGGSASGSNAPGGNSCIAVQTEHSTTVPTGVETDITIENAHLIYGVAPLPIINSGGFKVPTTKSYLMALILAYNSTASGAAELVLYEDGNAFEVVDFQLPIASYNGAAFVGAGGSEIMGYRFDTLTSGRLYTARVKQITGQDLEVYLPTGIFLFE